MESQGRGTWRSSVQWFSFIPLLSCWCHPTVSSERWLNKHVSPPWTSKSGGRGREALSDTLGNRKSSPRSSKQSTFHPIGPFSEPVIGKRNGITHRPSWRGSRILLPLRHPTSRRRDGPWSKINMLGRRTREPEAGYTTHMHRRTQTGDPTID